ncbi:MAG: hypothetical protein JKY54_16370 [Flavobacteriales bacterium]|nr:hypothetical protein [Flavobacteriales bacterium]
MKGRLLAILFVFACLAGSSQDRTIKLDAKLTAVEASKKIPVATVSLYDGGIKIDSTVTQNGRCFFDLKENHSYKIVFSKTGYVSKFLLLETTNIPAKAKKKLTVKVEMTLFTEKKGLKVDFLKTKPIGVARYEEIYKKIKWDEDYTRAIDELIIHATLDYHKKKKLGLLDVKSDSARTN